MFLLATYGTYRHMNSYNLYEFLWYVINSLGMGTRMQHKESAIPMLQVVKPINLMLLISDHSHDELVAVILPVHA